MRRFRTTTAGLIMAAGITAAAVGLATAATAAPARSAATGTYKTWHAAQKAAGFRLLKPARTYGLKLSGGVGVSTCTSRNVRKGTKQVEAFYYSITGQTLHLIGFVQDDAGRLCGPAPRVKVLGKVRVDGVTAVLGRRCVAVNKKPCGIAELVLTWTKRGHSFGLVTTNESRAHTVGFARNLVRVP